MRTFEFAMLALSASALKLQTQVDECDCGEDCCEMLDGIVTAAENILDAVGSL